MSDESSQVPEGPPPAADPQSVEGLFLAALAQTSAAEREAFLDEACGNDAQRRRRVEALLRAYQDAGSFLEKPPLGSSTPTTVSLEFLAPSEDPGLLGTLGPYEVYEMLGRGGMGIVFRARDPKLNRVVAIKVLAPELAANPSARQRFLREARAAASISHPHVVTIHAVDEGVESSEASVERSPQRTSLHLQHSTLPFIVMECVVGQTLQQKLDKQGCLRLTEILRIGHQIACGLAAAHKQGVIHRDIKPANMLLENGVERVKITDFGLARAADDVSITRTGEVSGTPQYMSPEQAQGEAVDHRSDLFSLGCVLYAMCTGRSPFRATTLAAAIRRVCDDTPRPIEEINPEVPAWLIAIVNRLLAKNPDERIQTAEEVEGLLGGQLAQLQQPAGRRPQTGTAASSRPRAVVSSPSRADLQARRSTRTAKGRMPTSVRVLLWVGTLTLLIPLWVLLAGFVFHADNRVVENAIIFGLICVPLAVAMLGIALSDRYWRSNEIANGLFLLFCILLGPIGILLYILRRDQSADRHEPVATAAEEARAHQPAAESRAAARAEMPQWLVTPLPGAVNVIAFLLFVVAGLVMGQAFEQWSDASGPVGICLLAAALPLELLAFQCALAAGVQFRWQHWLTLGLVALPLMVVGAQAPDQEFKLSLAAETDMVVLFTIGVYLTALVISLLLWGLSQPGPVDANGRTRCDRLGSVLIWSSVVVWAAPAVWALLIGVGALSPPPFAARGWIDVPVMMAVLFGGLLLGAGMILQRRILTPGLVRQMATASDPRTAPARTSPRPAPPRPGGASGWRVLGWMILGLVFIPGCLATLLVIPWFAMHSDIGMVTVQFDQARPVTRIVAHGDLRAARSQQRVTEHSVTSNPVRLSLPAGVYDLTMTYQADGLTGTFAKRVEVVAGKTSTLDVRPNVSLAHQFEHLDKSRLEKDGYPPARAIPLGEGQQAPFGGNPFTARSRSQSTGALLLDLQDPGLFVRLVDPRDDKEVSVRLTSQLGSKIAQTYLKTSETYWLAPGTYDVVVYDQAAGWKIDEGDPQVTQGQVTIVEGEFTSLEVRRDLQLLSQKHPDWSQSGFFHFYWGRAQQQWQEQGTTYQGVRPVTFTLSRQQAFVVQTLLLASAAGVPEVDVQWLVHASQQGPLAPDEMLGEGADAVEDLDLAALFSDGQHAAWGSLVVLGAGAETYRLAALDTSGSLQTTQRGGVNVTFEDDRLGALFEPPGRASNAAGDRRAEVSTSQSILLPAGEYRVFVEDDLAGWHTRTEFNETGPVRYEQDVIDVLPNKRVNLTIARDFHKMYRQFMRPPPAGFPALWQGARAFRWQGNTYELTQLQAIAVQRLLQAYARSEPDVHEGVLLSGVNFIGGRMLEEPMTQREAEGKLQSMTAEGHSLRSSVFDDGQHPAWGTLIVEGDKPNTYRLAELVTADAPHKDEGNSDSAPAPLR